ncbi:MAG TPA: hypothetical protein VNA69_03055 [Thermoanaerobaculia bacterium]|nr:hypothetical protein [Thermoanaerobaculia bacterium]
MTLLLVFFFSLTSPAISQCSWTPRYSAQTRATVFDVAVDAQNIVWIATGYGVQAFEPRTGGALDFAGRTGIPGSTRVVAAGNGYAFAGSGTRVYVLRRNGRLLEIVSSVEAGGTVNDIVFNTAKYLFVATSNGIAHFDLFDPAAPVRTTQLISTTKPTVTSLAVSGPTLYAADGDSSVELIAIANPALPQKTGTLTSHARSVTVHVAGSSLFVSDDLGQNTDVFSGTARIARFAYGSNAFAPLSGNSYFVGGDRMLRAIDITSTLRIAEIFEQALAPLGGTNNRIYSMTRSGNTLYVAAGDIGLVTYDVSGLLTRHPVVSYADGGRSSTRLIGTAAYFTDAEKMYELAVDNNGLAMGFLRSWPTPAPSLLHDHVTAKLVASSGNDVKIWSVETPTPSITFSVTFPAPVRSAVLSGNTIVAVLLDGSVWRASTLGGAPERVNLGAGTAWSIARDGAAIAIAHITDAGNTVIRYFADVASQPRTFQVDGALIGGVGLSATHLAVFTFKGISVIELASGATRVLPESHRVIPKQLSIAGNNLLALGNSSLAVWDVPSGAQVRQHALPADGVSMHAAGNLAAIAGSGSTLIDFTATLPTGAPILTNRYYAKATANGNDLYLFGDNQVDVFWTGLGTAPNFGTNVSAPGVTDVAALPQSTFAMLSAFGTVTTHSSAGAQLAQMTINEGSDAQPLSIFAAGNALWVSVIKGCLSGTCEKKTLALDPKTLAVTTSFSGGVVDVATTASRAYVLLSLPDEVRVYDISQPQLSQLATAAAPASATSIGFSGGKVYVLAEKVYAFSESLAPAGEHLNAITAPDAHMIIDGNCAILTGRTPHPELWALPSWTTNTTIEVPSTIRSIAMQPGRLYFLTDHSLEVWMTGTPASPTKRRSAR